MNELSYEGIDEAVLIHALYHGTRAVGMGVFHNRPSFSVEDARAHVEHVRKYADGDDGNLRFDYVAGRPIKVRLDPGKKIIHRADLYDRDAGEGECARILAELRAKAVAS